MYLWEWIHFIICNWYKIFYILMKPYNYIIAELLVIYYVAEYWYMSAVRKVISSANFDR